MPIRHRDTWVLPANAELTQFHGIMTVQGKPCRLAFALKENGNGADLSTLKGDDAFNRALQALHPSVLTQLQRANDVTTFVLELKEALGATLSDGAPSAFQPGLAEEHKLPSPAVYRHLMEELESVRGLPSCSVGVVGRSLPSEVTITFTDEMARRHDLVAAWTWAGDGGLAYSGGFKYTATLPIDLGLRAGAKLREATQAFVDAVQRLQGFWEVMDDLDEHTCTLGLTGSRRASKSRRIVLARHASLLLEVDPHAPNKVCQMSLVGPEEIIAPLRHNLNARLAKWDVGVFVRANLEAILGISLPPPSTDQGGPDGQDNGPPTCGICYQLEAITSQGPQPPTQQCENAQCGQHFHAACLQSWLQYLPTAHLAFDTLIGSCPYCTHSLSLPAPSALGYT